jgi:zinc D-Ala-D-Ala carboxypeptidase
LTAALEELRARHGRPIRIVSGYRCPVHNAQVHGAPDSQHMYGTAADLLPGVASVGDAEAAGFIGIGSRGAWATHVDMRDGPHARWSYDAG